MEHSKLINAFNKEIRTLQKRTVSEDELREWYTLIKESIQDDIKDGYKETIARNLTLGIGVHGGDYPKSLILNGEQEGWKYVTRFLYWEKHILRRLFKYKEVSSRTIGSIIGLALLWDMKELAQLARDYFQMIFEEDAQRYTRNETHHLFMALLHDLFVTEQINQKLYSVLPEQHVYRRVLDHCYTTDEELLSSLMSEISDYHIHSSLDLPHKFAEILCLNYIPYEIRLIQNMRQAEGLNNVSVDHPLLTTPLAQIPESKVEWDLAGDEVYQFLLKREAGS
ncbi:hypothetical protein C173_04996 [Paenibacillus sp. FSL R7-277]|uniref:Uncharacterized protein n=1 Tax=Paenibacillus silagei TaxID=1670801 RepID=A0ABS4NK26_9BACL|nr:MULTISPECIES: hypothetical protein [Paenibacillus]ETT77169.1 hypothetical protein C173_04996 [Paenibacillus sp. FSL R7-277]MBP2110403.1 hypothetical protein [Paenibacillus silagei]